MFPALQKLLDFIGHVLDILGLPGTAANAKTWHQLIARLVDNPWPWFKLAVVVFIVISTVIYSRRFILERFDMLISDAIDHIVKSGLSEPSYGSELYVETRALRAIFNQALKNKVRLAGRLSEADYPSPIPRKILRELHPTEVVVPPSNRYPEGKCWELVPASHLDFHEEHSMDGIYSDLKVCSHDIYKIWPRAKRKTERQTVGIHV